MDGPGEAGEGGSCGGVEVLHFLTPDEGGAATVYAAHVPPTTTREWLFQVFGRYGLLFDVQLMATQYGALSTLRQGTARMADAEGGGDEDMPAYAFIKYYSAAHAHKAVERLGRTRQFGVYWKLKISKPKEMAQYFLGFSALTYEILRLARVPSRTPTQPGQAKAAAGAEGGEPRDDFEWECVVRLEVPSAEVSLTGESGVFRAREAEFMQLIEAPANLGLAKKLVLGWALQDAFLKMVIVCCPSGKSTAVEIAPETLPGDCEAHRETGCFDGHVAMANISEVERLDGEEEDEDGWSPLPSEGEGWGDGDAGMSLW